MTRRRDSLATRRAIFDDHGGELRFWLGWVHGEIAGPVQDWLRSQARHDPALQEDIDTIDAARRDITLALEATGYLAARPATTASRPEAENLEELTGLVSQRRSNTRRRTRDLGFMTPVVGEREQPAQPRDVLRRALAKLADDERDLLFAQWQKRDAFKASLLRVFLPEQDRPPPRGELSESARRVRRAEERLRQLLGEQGPSLRALGPDALWQLLADEYGELIPAAAAPKKRRSAADTEVYRRVGRSLFQLLAAVDIPLPARDEAGEATLLLRHLVGREAIAHFRELAHWLDATRARLDRAGDPTFYAARDRLLLWLAPECFVTEGRRPHFELSFRLYLRARLKDYCRRKGRHPAGQRDLETAFRALDRQRIGDIVREAVEEAARAEHEAPALVGVPLAQALQWLKAAP
jgi:hypothetical protein